MAAGGALSRTDRRRDRAARLAGLARLAANGTVAAADISEGVTRAVHDALGMRTGPAGRTRGLTGFVYRWVRRIARLVGRGAAQAPAATDAATGTEAGLLAVLNGVMGDRLAADGNPLAIPMSFWVDGCPARTVRAGSPHLVLLVHGLCLDESCWKARADDETDVGGVAAHLVDGVAVGVRYNTGRHISDNGADLAVGVQALVDGWPVPVRSVTVLAHSMGGLVVRSAFAAAAERGLTWTERVRAVVCLGTPHHGSPVERVGWWVHGRLRAGRFSAPLARAAELRSAGVTDLRWGAVRRSDWHGRDRFGALDDVRAPLPLPDGVPFYAIAGTTARRRGTAADRLVGDGLVPVWSALGEHDDPARRLDFSGTRVLPATGHVRLLTDSAVAAQLTAWLGARPPGHPAAARA